MAVINREMIRRIPKQDAVVIAKISELCGDNIDINALRLLYLNKNEHGRKEMMKEYRKVIQDHDTNP